MSPMGDAPCRRCRDKRSATDIKTDTDGHLCSARACTQRWTLIRFLSFGQFKKHDSWREHSHMHPLVIRWAGCVQRRAGAEASTRTWGKAGDHRLHDGSMYHGHARQWPVMGAWSRKRQGCPTWHGTHSACTRIMDPASTHHGSEGRPFRFASRRSGPRYQASARVMC